MNENSNINSYFNIVFAILLVFVITNMLFHMNKDSNLDPSHNKIVQHTQPKNSGQGRPLWQTLPLVQHPLRPQQPRLNDFTRFR